MSDVLLKEKKGNELVLLAGLRLHKSGPDHFAGSGVLNNPEADARIRELFFNGTVFAGLLTDNGEFAESGGFQITALEFETLPSVLANDTGIAMSLERLTRQEPSEYLQDGIEFLKTTRQETSE